ncbi:FtsK/SpoIIIE domain-containing protein [Mycobacteroides salmoniphilum]|uniref:ESX-1 secretion system protein EccCb1 n=1 Tax=Mycobacteroides salmoniphilum TaxID=404941 RepID=A0A4R8T088_9MYCO|nr:FtsK/SpoIIIE domain-containing protein [Mycobacteroides salmoniphilum]TEA09166.1 ESX-1 secretion system protein EccCb1 [Mycobacteroides salmoniphilum]
MTETPSMPPVSGTPVTPPKPASLLTLRDQVIKLWSSDDYDGPRAYRPWLPTEPMLNPTAVNTLVDLAGPNLAHMSVPCGIIDRPFEHQQLPWIVNLTGESTSMAIGGGKAAGKTNLCETFMVSAAYTHSPFDLQFFCLDFNSQRLVQLEFLPHVVAAATRVDYNHVRRILNELTAVLTRRQRIFTAARAETDPARRVPTWDAYRRIRAAGDTTHPAANDPYGDIVIMIDGWDSFVESTWLPKLQVREHEGFMDMLKDLVTLGPSFGIHCIVTVTKWSKLRSDFRDNIPLKIDMRPADRNDLGTDNMELMKLVKSIPAISGRAVSIEQKHIMMGAPRLDGKGTCERVEDTYPETIATIEAKWKGTASPPKLAMAAASHPIADILAKHPVDPTAESSTRQLRWQLPIGIGENTSEAVLLDCAETPNVLFFSERACGKTTGLFALAQAIISRNSPQQVQFMTVDLRGGLAGIVPDEYMMKSGAPIGVKDPEGLVRPPQSAAITSVDQLIESVPALAGALQSRRELGLEGRPDIVVLVDNWHLLIDIYPEGMHAFTQAIMAPEARFHFVAACQASSMQKALFNTRTAMGAAWAMSAHSFLLSADKGDFHDPNFTLIKRPPGQAQYLRDKVVSDVVQIGNVPRG